MRSRISLISWAMVGAPSMNWTNRGGGSRSKKRSFRVLLRKLRVIWSRKKTRCRHLIS